MWLGQVRGTGFPLDRSKSNCRKEPACDNSGFGQIAECRSFHSKKCARLRAQVVSSPVDGPGLLTVERQSYCRREIMPLIRESIKRQPYINPTGCPQAIAEKRFQEKEMAFRPDAIISSPSRYKPTLEGLLSIRFSASHQDSSTNCGPA